MRDDGAVALDRTVFYPTGGGQPHDTGTLGDARVIDVKKDGDLVWHTLDGPAPAEGTDVNGEVDWDRRHALMRTHTALHVLCGVIWNQWGTAVTGGNMEPLEARMDFEFDPLPEGFGAESSSSSTRSSRRRARSRCRSSRATSRSRTTTSSAPR